MPSFLASFAKHLSDLSALEELAALRCYRKQDKSCPYETHSHRSDMKEILHRLEAMNPDARYSLWGSMTNVQSDLLPIPCPEEY